MDITSAFDRRLQHLPHDWRGPLVDVLDTAETVRLRLQEWGMEDNAEALVGLTRLVLEQHRQEREP
jgi:hypothetical protein